MALNLLAASVAGSHCFFRLDCVASCWLSQLGAQFLLLSLLNHNASRLEPGLPARRNVIPMLGKQCFESYILRPLWHCTGITDAQNAVPVVRFHLYSQV